MITYDYYRELIKAKAGSLGLDIHSITGYLSSFDCCLDIYKRCINGEYDEPDSDDIRQGYINGWNSRGRLK